MVITSVPFVSWPIATEIAKSFLSPYRVGRVAGKVSDLRVKKLNSATFAVAFTTSSAASEKSHGDSRSTESFSTGREFDDLPVRYWDHYLDKDAGALWVTKLHVAATSTFGSGQYKLDMADPFDILKGIDIRRPKTTNPPDNKWIFDISTHGLVVVGKSNVYDPDPKMCFKAELYFVPFPKALEFEGPAQPRKIELPGFPGRCSSPVFSPDGTSVAFLKLESAYADDGHQHLFVAKINSTEITVSELFNSPEQKTSWSLSPDSIKWNLDGSELLLLAEDRGHRRLYSASSIPTSMVAMPEPLTTQGSVSAVYSARDSSHSPILFVSTSSWVESSDYLRIDPSNGKTDVISSQLGGGSKIGLDASQISEIWFKGSDDVDIHAWVIKPSNFNADEKYPVMFRVHGGPVAAVNDEWILISNNLFFAEQGYIVVLPNFSGSTGYGREHMERIDGHYADRPYTDVLRCFEYVENHLPYIDINRAVAFGGSYGGFMMNWIAGQPLGKRFKALVTHDGMLSLGAHYSHDAIFIASFFGGEIWDKQEMFDKCDPMRYTHNWTTPMLVIHSDLDFRCPITEGLAPYTVLQTRGVRSRFLNFPDEGHWVVKPENSLHWFKVVLEWINEHTGTDAINQRTALELRE